MSDTRYLIRLLNPRTWQPKDQTQLMDRARGIALTLSAKAINLRVSSRAVEFDLFCPPVAETGQFAAAFRSMGKVLTCKELDATPPADNRAGAIVAEARRLFNEERFWEVHEVLESLWKKTTGQEKDLVQGLILCAAALVHFQKNEDAVGWAMLADAMRRIGNKPASYYDWNIEKLRAHFARVLTTKILEIPAV